MTFSLIEQKLQSAIDNINSHINDLHTIATNKSKISFNYIRKIGKGTFGVVYKIKTVENEIFAFKTVFEDFKHFYREIEILKDLEHENIVRLEAYGYDGVCDDGEYALLFMEYVPLCLKDVIYKNLWDKIFKKDKTRNNILRDNRILQKDTQVRSNDELTELKNGEQKSFLVENYTDFDKKLEISSDVIELEDQIPQKINSDSESEFSNDGDSVLQVNTSAFDERIVISFLKQGFSALSYMHSKGICHRDIKPSNILISYDGTLKICDLGSAKKLDSDSTTYICSRFYRAPENIIGIRSYTFKIDVWAFSLSIVEIFIKKVLFRGTSNSDQLEKILSLVKASQRDLSAMKLRRKKKETVGIRRYMKKYTKNKSLVEVFDTTIKFNHYKRKTAGEVLKMKLFKS